MLLAVSAKFVKMVSKEILHQFIFSGFSEVSFWTQTGDLIKVSIYFTIFFYTRIWGVGSFGKSIANLQ